MLSETNALFFSLLGGIVPAFFWLWFWIREDRLRPEPKSALLSAFIGGIFAVLLSLFLELIIYYLLLDASPIHIKSLPDIIRVALQGLANRYDLISAQTNYLGQIQGFFTDWAPAIIKSLDLKKFFLIVIIAPVIEESLKLLLTYNICLRRKVNDEPIDASIYMLTTALGFAAIETALFLIDPFTKGQISDSLIAVNFRSIGPMLIHLVSSAMLGIFIGLAFYKNKIQKFFYLILGLIVAITIHILFNFFIMLNDTTHNIMYFLVACLGTWIFVVILLVSFEKVKRVSHLTRKK